MIGALHMETSFVICFQVCESTFVKSWPFVILIYERLRQRTILQRPQKLFFYCLKHAFTTLQRTSLTTLLMRRILLLERG